MIVVVGLRGKKHPALLGVVTTHEVKKSRIHLKMQVGDYLTYQTKSNRSRKGGGHPFVGLVQKTHQKIKI